MADESDAGNALVALLTQAFYPNGTGVESLLGYPATIGRGWPTPAALKKQRETQQVIISVFGQNATERNVTRFSRDWKQLTEAIETVTATLVGNVMTFGGDTSKPQNVMILVGSLSEAVTRLSAVYAVQPGDTLTTIATALAGLLTGLGVVVSSAGPTLTFANTSTVEARIGGWASVAREIKRQERRFQITAWCKTPAQRDQVSPIIDLALSIPSFIRYADGTVGRILYERTMVLDEKQTLEIYRRDFIYCLEYPTIETKQATKILVVETQVEAE